MQVNIVSKLVRYMAPLQNGLNFIENIQVLPFV